MTEDLRKRSKPGQTKPADEGLIEPSDRVLLKKFRELSVWPWLVGVRIYLLAFALTAVSASPFMVMHGFLDSADKLTPTIYQTTAPKDAPENHVLLAPHADKLSEIKSGLDVKIERLIDEELKKLVDSTEFSVLKINKTRERLEGLIKSIETTNSKAQEALVREQKTLVFLSVGIVAAVFASFVLIAQSRLLTRLFANGFSNIDPSITAAKKTQRLVFFSLLAGLATYFSLAAIGPSLNLISPPWPMAWIDETRIKDQSTAIALISAVVILLFVIIEGRKGLPALPTTKDAYDTPNNAFGFRRPAPGIAIGASFAIGAVLGHTVVQEGFAPLVVFSPPEHTGLSFFAAVLTGLLVACLTVTAFINAISAAEYPARWRVHNFLFHTNQVNVKSASSVNDLWMRLAAAAKSKDGGEPKPGELTVSRAYAPSHLVNRIGRSTQIAVLVVIAFLLCVDAGISLSESYSVQSASLADEINKTNDRWLVLLGILFSVVVAVIYIWPASHLMVYLAIEEQIAKDKMAGTPKPSKPKEPSGFVAWILGLPVYRTRALNLIEESISETVEINQPAEKANQPRTQKESSQQDDAKKDIEQRRMSRVIGASPDKMHIILYSVLANGGFQQLMSQANFAKFKDVATILAPAVSGSLLGLF